MKDQSQTNLCARAQDLVAYLYGEASAPEARDFEAHMRLCASCAAELEAFGQVRASIGAWRTEALAGLSSPALATAYARKPSALAALREFFALSPMWLRGATAFAGLALCALVVFAVAGLMKEPRVVVVEKRVETGPTQAEINTLVEKRVQEQLAVREQREEKAPQPEAAPVRVQKDSVITASMTNNSSSLSRRSSIPRRAIARVSTQESEQIARDLQLIPTRDEEDSPRLIDLMDEAN